MAVLEDLCTFSFTFHRDRHYGVEFYISLNLPVCFTTPKLTTWMQYQKHTYLMWCISTSAKWTVSLPSSMVLISSLCSTIRNNRNKKETHGGMALAGDFKDALPLSPFDAGGLSFSALGADTLPLSSLEALELMNVMSDKWNQQLK